MKTIPIPFVLAAPCLALVQCLAPVHGQSVSAPVSAWADIEAKAAAGPATGHNMYRSVLGLRELLKPYYAKYAGWTAPEPLAVAEGRLRNLGEKPKAPRFPLTGKTWPAKDGEASVCLWEDDKVAAVSFSIDDNNATDIPAWMEISKNYGGLNLTWNIVTDNVDGVIARSSMSSAGSWDTWARVLAAGFRVESHSVTHAGDPVFEDGWPGPDWEAAESIRQIDAGLPGHRTTVFTPPGSPIKHFSVSSNWRSSVVKYYLAQRGFSGSPINPANQTDYFEIRTTAAPAAFVEDPLPPGAPSWIVQSQLKKILDPDPANKAYRGWATFFTHYIGPAGADLAANQSKETAALAKVFKFFNDHRADLWIGCIGDVALYGQERDTATLTTLGADATGIRLELVSKMDPALFNYPLTVKVRLPASWTAAKALQNGKAVPVQYIRHEGAPYALVKALPDRGEIVLSN